MFFSVIIKVESGVKSFKYIFFTLQIMSIQWIVIISSFLIMHFLAVLRKFIYNIPGGKLLKVLACRLYRNFLRYKPS